MSSATQKLLTIEEFLQLPDYEHLEIVRGQVIKTMPPSKDHGIIAVAIATLLRNSSPQTGVQGAKPNAGVLGVSPN